MSTIFLNYCDKCGCVTDIIYIDELTGDELCLDCYNEIEEEEEDFFDD